MRSDQYQEIKELPLGDGFDNRGDSPRHLRKYTKGLIEKFKSPLVKKVEKGQDFAKMSQDQIKQRIKN